MVTLTIIALKGLNGRERNRERERERERVTRNPTEFFVQNLQCYVIMFLTSQRPHSCYKHINERRTTLLRRYFLSQFWLFPTYSCKYIIIYLSFIIKFYVLSFRLKKKSWIIYLSGMKFCGNWYGRCYLHTYRNTKLFFRKIICCL